MNQPSDQPAPIVTGRDAEKAIAELNTIMDELLRAVEEETAHVGAGHLAEAARLSDAKIALSRRYARESARLRDAKDVIARFRPGALDDLRARHEAFHTVLRKNLTVLATAHAVSEGIIRGVSGEMARKQMPSTYGATGRANVPSPKASQPMAISRSL